MKKLVFVIFVAVFAIGSSIAQQRDPAARLKSEIDGLSTELGLSKDQVDKVTTIVTAAQKKQSEAYAKMREAGNTDRAKMGEERAKMQTETDKAIKAVITKDQGVKLDAFRKTQAEERAKRAKERGQ